MEIKMIKEMEVKGNKGRGDLRSDMGLTGICKRIWEIKPS